MCGSNVAVSGHSVYVKLLQQDSKQYSILFIGLVPSQVLPKTKVTTSQDYG